MTPRRKLLAIALVLASTMSCKPSNTGGLDLHGKPHIGKREPPKEKPPEDPKKPDANEAHQLAWQAIGCFIGGPWSEALGASGEERMLADTKRCREVATGPLGAKPEDEKALDAVRGVDPDAVARVLTGLQAKYGGKGDEKLLQLVRATADAAREAQAVRRVTEAMRTSKTKEPSDAELTTLSAKDALSALGTLGTEEAKLVQLVLGADRVESSRGLAPRAKILAASPGLQVVFGVASPAVKASGVESGAKTASEEEQTAWVTYLATVAKAAGHPPKAEPTPSPNEPPVPKPSLDEQEQAAFTGIAEGFADRFAALSTKLPKGVAKDVASGYAERLRTELANAEVKQKSKTATKKSDAETKAKVTTKPKVTKPPPKKSATSP